MTDVVRQAEVEQRIVRTIIAQFDGVEWDVAKVECGRVERRYADEVGLLPDDRLLLATSLLAGGAMQIGRVRSSRRLVPSVSGARSSTASARFTHPPRDAGQLSPRSIRRDRGDAA